MDADHKHICNLRVKDYSVSTFTNMATVRICLIIFDKLSLMGICINGNVVILPTFLFFNCMRNMSKVVIPVCLYACFSSKRLKCSTDFQEILYMYKPIEATLDI